MAEELRAGLTLDLSELTARLRVQEAQAELTERKVETTGRKLVKLEAEHSTLDRSLHRFEHKLAHISRDFFKQAVSIGAASLLSEHEPHGFFSGLISSFATGTLFSGGNVGVGGTAATIFLIHHLIEAVRGGEHRLTKAEQEAQEQRKLLYEMRRTIAEDKKERADVLRNLSDALAGQALEEIEKMRDVRRKLFEEIRKNFQEDLYQTMLFLGQEGMN